MHWFKIEINKGKGDTYHYLGRSDHNADALIQRAQNGLFIRLDDLLYMDRGEVKEWGEWDKMLVPSAWINPKDVVSVMEFKGDPRELPAR